MLIGGKVLKAGKFTKGYYISPTIIVGLPVTHRLFKDELFMPLVVVDEFKTIEEAFAKVNDTEYGLTAGIFSENPQEVTNLHEPSAIRRPLRKPKRRSNHRSMARRTILYRLERKRRNRTRRRRITLSAQFSTRPIPNNRLLIK